MTKERNQRIVVILSATLILFIWAFIHPQSALAQWTTNGSDINSTNTGNVGIGTTAPTTKLTITDGGTPFTAAATDLLQLKRGTTNSTASDGVSFVLGNNSNGFRIRYGGTSDRLGFIDGGLGEVLSLVNGGSVGIGTTNPLDRFHLKGGSLRVDMDNAPSAFAFLLTGNMNGGGNGGYPRGISLQPTLTSTTAGNLILFQTALTVGTGVAQTDLYQYYIGNPTLGSGASITNNYGLYITNQTAGTNNYSIYSVGGKNYFGGNVGIGTTTPQAALDVNGSINVSGNINAKYQDVAEWVPSSQKLSAGTVVILDPEKSNQVIASTESYDTRVAGVISEQPGVLLGEAGEGKVKVATTGRVRVKVDASRGAIKIGDLLVTSNKEGWAMKSEPIVMQGRKIHAPGTIIGKALEPLATGKGEILVLLSLQ